MSFVAYIMQRTLELELERNDIEYSHEKIREAIKKMEYIEFKTNQQNHRYFIISKTSNQNLSNHFH